MKTTSTHKLFALLLALVMVLGMLPMTAFATEDDPGESNPIHTKEGYTNVWSEDFESGIPSTWSMEDKDDDGFNWKWSKDARDDPKYHIPCHGDWCILSESYDNKAFSPLSPDNWLYLPKQTLKVDGKYLLTFMIAAQDKGYSGDRVGVYISTDGGTEYTQIGEDYTSPAEWDEIEIDLSAYAGETINLAVVHHNCYDKFVVKLDCFNLWEKGGTTPVEETLIESVEANGTQIPVPGKSLDWTMPTIPEDADYYLNEYFAWVETDFEVSDYSDLYDFEADDWRGDCNWYYSYEDAERTFQVGKYYTLCIWLEPNEGFRFAPINGMSGKIDDEEAGVSDFMGGLTLFRTFGSLTAATDPCISFTDIDRNAWYHKAVDYAISSGMMAGMPNNKFAPNGNMTRAQFVQILYSLEGKPAVTYKKTFTDVKEGSWYTNAVLWAADNGVVSGIGNNRFDPDGNVTREQMATILFQYFGTYKGVNVSVRADLSKFSDEKKISSWAYEALQWANAAGLINGVSNGGIVTLAPKGIASRAQVAQVFYSYFTK